MILSLIKILKITIISEVQDGSGTKNKMSKKKIYKLRSLLTKNNIDGYIIPKNDAYFSEFSLPDD